MSIFVKNDDVVDVEVHYTEENGNIDVLEQPSDKSVTLKIKFRRPDFSISQRLVASSTTLDQSGNPSVNLLMLQNNMLYFLAKEWDAKEPDTKDGAGEVIKGKSVEMNAENIGNLRVEIARAIVAKLIPVVGQII